ncbi:MAG: septum formation initiator family protein [Bacillota bacterium]|jgi:cell division protein FtsL
MNTANARQLVNEGQYNKLGTAKSGQTSNNKRANSAKQPYFTRKFVVTYLILLAITVALALAYVAFSTSAVAANMEIAKLEGQLAQLQMQQEQYEVKIAKLSSFDKIEAEAKDKLQMETDKSQIVVATLPLDDGPASMPATRPGDLREKQSESMLAKIGRWIASIGYAQASMGE